MRDYISELIHHVRNELNRRSRGQINVCDCMYVRVFMCVSADDDAESSLSCLFIFTLYVYSIEQPCILTIDCI